MASGGKPRHRTGAYDDEVPPVPIPNTEVKLIRAEDTWRATAWEDRSVPVPRIWMILHESSIFFCRENQESIVENGDEKLQRRNAGVQGETR